MEDECSVSEGEAIGSFPAAAGVEGACPGTAEDWDAAAAAAVAADGEDDGLEIPVGDDGEGERSSGGDDASAALSGIPVQVIARLCVAVFCSGDRHRCLFVASVFLSSVRGS